MKRVGLFACALLMVAGQMGGQAPKLKPKPLLPIDCGEAQPCTGTQCALQQAEFYCTETQQTFTCQNDTQNYVGGPVICCTGRNFCYDCPYNGRTHHYYSYNGGNRSAPSGCVYNGPYNP